MEFFPAADDTAWEIIKRVIKECDFYVVIVAGRYGSLSEEGISYTQKEYEYAVKCGVPVMAFLHGDPGKIPSEKTEGTEKAKQKLEEFRTICRKRLCKHWKTPDELAGAVIKSLNQLKKTQPRIGWVRADQFPDESTSREMLKLKRRIEELESEREELRTNAPTGTADLAQGIERHNNTYMVSNSSIYYGEEDFKQTFNSTFTWNDIFARIAPLMINEAHEYSLQSALSDMVSKKEKDRIFEKLKTVVGDIESNGKISIPDEAFHTIFIQLRSLGLIVKSVKQRSIKDTSTYWKLTQYGDSQMTKLLAINKSKAARPARKLKPRKLID